MFQETPDEADLKHLENNVKPLIRKHPSYLIKKAAETLQNGKRKRKFLKQQNSEKNKIPLVLITKYHNSIGKIGFYFRKHWNKLKRDEKCRNFFTENPITSYCRHKNLGDYIINSKI